jgi:hypothetical protein
MRFYGLLIDLSWERRIEQRAPYLSALIVSTPAATEEERRRVSEVMVSEPEADDIRHLIRRRVHVIATFKGDMFYSKPSDVNDFGEEKLDRILPELPILQHWAQNGLGLFKVKSDDVRAVSFGPDPVRPTHIAFESADLSGPLYADRVFAAYQLKPWLRRERPSFKMLFQAEECLVVVRQAGGRPSLIGVLPMWD